MKAAAAMALVGSINQSAAAEAPALASPWVTEQAARSRLIAGGVGADGTRPLYAGLEIALEDGWKTYWRNPGSSGVPPGIDWAGSENIASVKLEFPAPQRFKDKDGDTIGYKHGVVLPLLLKLSDPAKPAKLKLNAEFGICRDVCIPVQPKLSLDLPANAARQPAGSALQQAVRRVPRSAALSKGDPQLQSIKVDLNGPKPSIVIAAKFPGADTKADVFLEAPDGIWIPLPRPDGNAKDGVKTFRVDLTEGADIADLKGRTIRATLVGAEGQSEASFPLN
ncbi:MAG: protein-disulfide reductase DsbD family protein [Hyphomicrobiaceae bacterium]